MQEALVTRHKSISGNHTFISFSISNSQVPGLRRWSLHEDKDYMYLSSGEANCWLPCTQTRFRSSASLSESEGLGSTNFVKVRMGMLVFTGQKVFSQTCHEESLDFPRIQGNPEDSWWIAGNHGESWGITGNPGDVIRNHLQPTVLYICAKNPQLLESQPVPDESSWVTGNPEASHCHRHSNDPRYPILVLFSQGHARSLAFLASVVVVFIGPGKFGGTTEVTHNFIYTLLKYHHNGNGKKFRIWLLRLQERQ